MHEREFVLATTLEYVSLPPNLAGLVFGRSSWDRLGIAIPTTRIPPGFRGCISIQIVSRADVPVTLIPGTRICQLMLVEASSPVSEDSRYGVLLHPTHSRIYDDWELHAFAQGKFARVFGIAGTLGSGKSTAATYFVQNHGFLHLSLASELYNEIRQRGLQPTQTVLQDLGDSLRRSHGSGILAERVRSRMAALPGGSNVVLEGIKNVAEVRELRRWGNFTLIALDTPFEQRQQRVMDRARPGDPKSRAEFEALDKRDRGEGEPEWGQGVDRCIEEADIPIDNSGSIEDLYTQLDDTIYP